MTAMSLADRLRALDQSVLPVWVYDHDALCFRWANPAALELWQASSLAEFLARDVSNPSASTRTRLDNYLLALKKGQRVSEDWTLYPHGKPQTMTLHGSAIELDDGRLAILFQAVQKETPIEPSMIRGVEALRHTALMVSIHDEQGRVLFHNPAALQAFGNAPSISEWFADGGQALLDNVQRGEVFAAETQVTRTDGQRWHSLRATPITDPVTGGRAGLLQQLDIDQQRSAEDRAEARGRLVEELHRTVAVVEEQRKEILALSAPILDVGAQTAALPLIGQLTPERLIEISHRLLHAVQTERRRFVILDLTGCQLLDERSARGLNQLLEAIALLGAQAILTGIRPQLAQAMVSANLELSRLTTMRTLRDGIEFCRRLIARGTPST